MRDRDEPFHPPLGGQSAISRSASAIVQTGDWVASTDVPMDNVVPFERPDRLIDRAARCTTLVRVAGLLEHIGSRAKLTGNGNLRLADVRALAERFGCAELVDPVIGDTKFRTPSSVGNVPVDLIFRWARSAGFVRVVHGSVLRTARGKRIGADPMDDWSRLFDAFVRKLRWPETSLNGWHAPRYFWLGEVSDAIGRSLRAVAHARGEPVWVMDIAIGIVLDLGKRYDLSSLPEHIFNDLPRDVAWALRVWAFEPLGELDVVRLEGPITDPEMNAVLGPGAPKEYRVRSTPLGARAVAGLGSDVTGE